MKSLYILTRELADAVRMLEDSLKAWGTPNGWDTVKAHLEDAIRDTKKLTDKDIPATVAARSLEELVLHVMDVQDGEDGRVAELELFQRLHRRKRAFTIQGPAALIYAENGQLRFRTLRASETFSGKFLAYHVGHAEEPRLNVWNMPA
jgi:hypothetical protein